MYVGPPSKIRRADRNMKGIYEYKEIIVHKIEKTVKMNFDLAQSNDIPSDQVSCSIDHELGSKKIDESQSHSLVSAKSGPFSNDLEGYCPDQVDFSSSSSSPCRETSRESCRVYSQKSQTEKKVGERPSQSQRSRSQRPRSQHSRSQRPRSHSPKKKKKRKKSKRKVKRNNIKITMK